MNQVIQFRYFAVGVGNDGKTNHGVLCFVDILDPFLMLVGRIHRQCDHLDAALFELRFQFGSQAKLSGADWSEVSRM